MRLRHAAAAAVALLVAGVVAYQALTHTPPEPFVARTGQIEPPVMWTVCVDGVEFIGYELHNGGGLLDPIPTGRRC